eukprot:7708456-Pyramimonas_sp.AAC.1
MPKSSTRYLLREALRVTSCRLGRTAAGIVERRDWAAGGHHHRPASNLKPSSSLIALREFL